MGRSWDWRFRGAVVELKVSLAHFLVRYRFPLEGPSLGIVLLVVQGLHFLCTPIERLAKLYLWSFPFGVIPS